MKRENVTLVNYDKAFEELKEARTKRLAEVEKLNKEISEAKTKIAVNENKLGLLFSVLEIDQKLTVHYNYLKVTPNEERQNLVESEIQQQKQLLAALGQ